MPVIHRPHLFDEIRRVGAHAPLVAVGADFGVRVEVVQQHKLAHDLVQVRRDALREKAQLRVAVALRQVAEHLVVGAVFFHDVEAVLDGARLAGPERDGTVHRAPRRNTRISVEWAAAIGLGRVAGELLLEFLTRRQVDDAQGALEQPGDDLHLLTVRRLDPGLRPARVGLGREAFAIGDQQVLAVRRHAHRGGIPADRNEPQRAALARLRHVKDGHGVVVGVRHKERLFVRRKGHAVRRGPGRSLGIERRANCLQGFARRRVEDRHGVPARIGHEQQLPRAGERHFARMLLGRPAGDDLLRL